MKLSEAFALYAAESGALNTAPSQRTYRDEIRRLISYSGDKPLNSYTPAELAAFCLGEGGRGHAPNTIAGRRTRIRSVFHWCHRRRLISRDPTLDLEDIKIRGGNVRENTWLTKPETATIAGKFNLEDPRSHRDYVVFRTTLMLGLRRSETASLRWSMFRSDLSTVSIVGKGRKLATLAVPKALRDALGTWRSLEPDDAVPFPRFNWHHDFHGNWRMVPKWTTPLTGAGVYEIIRHYAGVAPHDLRRSFCGILEADGVPLKDVQGLMRHSNLATTDRYLQNSPERLRTVVDGFDWGS